MFEYAGRGLEGIHLKNGYTIVESSYGQGAVGHQGDGAADAAIVLVRTEGSGPLKSRYSRGECAHENHAFHLWRRIS